jgi:hypothetical protein
LDWSLENIQESTEIKYDIRVAVRIKKLDLNYVDLLRLDVIDFESIVLFIHGGYAYLSTSFEGVLFNLIAEIDLKGDFRVVIVY